MNNKTFFFFLNNNNANLRSRIWQKCFSAFQYFFVLYCGDFQCRVHVAGVYIQSVIFNFYTENKE